VIRVLLLALDTSTPAVTAALHDGTRVVAESTVVDARRHGELLAPRIAAVLAQVGAQPGDLTVVAAGVGPGPFTGLRVGVVTALTLGAALGIPVHGICSLDALAWATQAERAAEQAGVAGRFVVVTDARRREVYWAAYADGRTREAPATVDRPADVMALHGSLPFVGPGAELCDVAVARPTTLSAAALAEVVAHRLAHGGELLEPRPLYLRRPDATPPGERKRVLA
jgi:tRNA threonylcarbamoyl adenosine modification protein YeaZ